MKILLLGRDGQLGQALAGPLAALGEVTALGRRELDLAQTADVRATLRHLQPELVVNAAAYTAVDKAESEPELAMRINTLAVGAMGEEAARMGARVVHYSTDYVFDGNKAGAYVESDATGPLNIYGQSKLAGENALLGSGAQAVVLRTSWVYAATGRNFLQTMLRLGRERDQVRVVDDQVGAPTSAGDLAAATVVLLGVWDGQPGLYHASARGSTSWAGFAREIFLHAGLETTVQPIATEEYPTPARRPRNSRLDCGRLARLGVALPEWQDGLAQVMRETGR